MKYFNQLSHFQVVERKHHGSLLIWRLWERRFRTRKQLHALLLTDPDHLHTDPELSINEVLADIEKPFWENHSGDNYTQQCVGALLSIILFPSIKDG